MPGQYVHIARHLSHSGHEVSFISQPRAAQIAGVRKLEYKAAAPSDYGRAHTRELESGVTNGLAVARLCEWLARDGFVPDIVISHNENGEKFSTSKMYGQQHPSHTQLKIALGGTGRLGRSRPSTGSSPS